MTRLFAFFAILVFAQAATAAEPELQVTDVVVGTGKQAEEGMRVTVHYTGWLMDGTKFDSSKDRRRPFTFTLGQGRVIKGWEIGVKGMRVGGKRELVIPPELGYGPYGAPPRIPGNATLKFEVELLDVGAPKASLQGPKYANVGNDELKALLERGVKIIDIRRAEEWAQTGVVEGSELITAFNKQGKVEQTFLQAFTTAAKPHEEVILICRTGNRTRLIADALSARFGYEKIYNVTDGITKWIKDGNPVVQPNRGG